MGKIVKKRNWAFVLYPESAPENWRDIIIQSGLPFAVSPLHDKDINATGEPKKSHYHIILLYSGPTTFNVVNKFVSGLNCPIPQDLESVEGYYKYFTHEHNPEKAQYNADDIQVFNGFDIRDYVSISKNELKKLKINIQLFIRENNIKEYALLMDLLLDNDMIDEWEVASNNTVFFDRYISSRRYEPTTNKK